MPFLGSISAGAPRAICGLIALLVAITGCTRTDERVFTVRGVVRAPYADGAITIRHEEIPGFMPAMTMPFFAEADDARGLAPGDRVEFEFRVSEHKSRAARFRKIGVAPGAGAEAASTPSPAPRLRPGDAVPPFALTDQEDRAVTAADFKGRDTVVSFIFTRCPVPEFCPLIARKLQAVQAQLATRGAPAARAHLLTVTIDPEYDRPAVLRDYGQSLGADFDRWRFATGSVEQVEALAKRFAVRVERNGQSLDHTLATALIGPDGRVVEIWRGNAWKPEEIVERMVPAAGR